MYGLGFDKELIALDEAVFTDVIDSTNLQIKMRNEGKPTEEREPYLDKKYLLRRYRTIKEMQRIREFRAEHECKYCDRYRGENRCKAKDVCPYDEASKPESDEKGKGVCSKHPELDRCPYAGPDGICVSFCMLDVINAMRKKNAKKEEEKDSG